MPDAAYIYLRDYDGEITKSKFNTLDLTAGNFAAQSAALATLRTAVDNITRGTVAESRLQILVPGSGILPSDEEAQIEKGWLVTYVDSQQFLDPGTDTVPNPGFGEPYTSFWPTAEYTGHLDASSDFADLTDPDISAFIDAFEALVLSPFGGTVEVQTIRVAGADN